MQHMWKMIIGIMAVMSIFIQPAVYADIINPYDYETTLEETGGLYTTPVSDMIRLDFDLYFNQSYPTFRAELQGDDIALMVNVNQGMVYINQSEAAVGTVGKRSTWLMRVDSVNDRFCIIINGTCVAQGPIVCQTSAYTFTVSGEDSGYIYKRYFGKGEPITVPLEVTSEFLDIDGEEITGFRYGTMAGELISMLDISANGVARIYTKSGIPRTGAVQPGDYMQVSNGVETKKYVFPGLAVGSLAAQFCTVDLNNRVISHVVEGLTKEQFIGGLTAGIDFSASIAGEEEIVQDGDRLEIVFADKTHEQFTISTAKTQDMIYYEDFQNEESGNWYINAGQVSSVWIDQKPVLVFQSAGSSNAYCRRYIQPISGPVVVETVVRYEYPQNAARQFYGPCLESSDGAKIQLKQRRGEFTVIGADGAENALGIAAAPNRWYKIKMIVQPEEQYILYIDDQLACSLPIRGAMPDVAQISYNLYSPDTNETGALYMDSFKIYRPQADLGAMAFYSNGQTVYQAQALSSVCEKIDLIFSDSSSSRLDAGSAVKTVVLMDGQDCEIDTEIQCSDNTVSIIPSVPLSNGQYSIRICGLKTIYDEEGGLEADYRFTIGKPECRIRYAELYTDGYTAAAEIAVDYTAETSMPVILYLAVYDQNGKLVGVGKDELEFSAENKQTHILAADLRIPNTAVYGKLFLWQDTQGLTPLTTGYVQKLK